MRCHRVLVVRFYFVWFFQVEGWARDVGGHLWSSGCVIFRGMQVWLRKWSVGGGWVGRRVSSRDIHQNNPQRQGALKDTQQTRHTRTIYGVTHCGILQSDCRVRLNTFLNSDFANTGFVLSCQGGYSAITENFEGGEKIFNRAEGSFKRAYWFRTTLNVANVMSPYTMSE